MGGTNQKGMKTRTCQSISDVLRSLAKCFNPHYSLPLRNVLIKLGVLRLRTKLRLYLWRVERLFFGLFRRKKRVCILTRQPSLAGLFAQFRYFLGGIAYADRRGMLPVVDMKNSANAYLYDYEVGHVNSWEYYFEQPSGISLDEAEKLEDVLRLEVGRYPVPRQDGACFRNEDGQLDYWRGICRRYIRFTKPVLDRLERMERQYSGRKILGVLARGTDYVKLRVHDHPVQPEPEEVIAKVQEAMKTEGYDYVYLATEDKRILAKFQEAFGDKLLLPESKYFDYDYDNPEYLYKYMNNDKYTLGLEYLVSMLFLSKCPGFITSITSGAIGVMCLSEGFEYLYVFDLGRYE